MWNNSMEYVIFLLVLWCHSIERHKCEHVLCLWFLQFFSFCCLFCFYFFISLEMLQAFDSIRVWSLQPLDGTETNITLYLELMKWYEFIKPIDNMTLKYLWTWTIINNGMFVWIPIRWKKTRKCHCLRKMSYNRILWIFFSFLRLLIHTRRREEAPRLSTLNINKN